VTLPVEALRAAGLRPGVELDVRADGPGRITLERSDDPVTRLAGTLRYPKGYLKKLRREWRY
jgi:bifunctional DNA-binding transcriptional regulator/antitoxin component of YhaV-PrlF toxin-antitoxin module